MGVVKVPHFMGYGETLELNIVAAVDNDECPLFVPVQVARKTRRQGMLEHRNTVHLGNTPRVNG